MNKARMDFNRQNLTNNEGVVGVCDRCGCQLWQTSTPTGLYTNFIEIPIKTKCIVREGEKFLCRTCIDRDPFLKAAMEGGSGIPTSPGFLIQKL